MLKGVPLGVANLKPVKLDDRQRRTILDIVGKSDRKKADQFIQRIEQAIATYLATKDLDQYTRPSIVRKSLKQLRNTADKQLRQLGKLDGISRSLIDDPDCGRTRDMEKKIEGMISYISEALIKAENLPNSRRVDYPTRFLAKDVGMAMEELGLRPTKTRNSEDASGTYDRCLEAVMEASGRRPNLDMMRVMQAGKALLDATTYVKVDRSRD